MAPDLVWLWLGRASASVAVLLTVAVLVPALYLPAYFRRHFFFLFFLTTVCVYLQVAPVLAQMASPPAIALVLGLPLVQDFTREYAYLQVASLLALQVPLIGAYLVLHRRAAAGVLVVRERRAQVILAGSTVLTVLFLAVVLRNGLWYLRLGDALTDRLVEMPFLDFVVMRTFQETGLFVIGVLTFLWRLGTGGTKTAALWCLIFFVGVFGGYNLLNSRWFVISLIVSLAGWFIMSAPVPSAARHARRLAAVAALGVVAFYLAILVVNVRQQIGDGLGVAVLNPIGGGILADTQGISRLDCMDLMARLKPHIDRDGPAMGAAWGQVVWLVWRFIDTDGFDAFRLTRQTTAKSYLMREYLGVTTSDYFSCMATDLYGNFHIPGLAVGGLIIGALFRWANTAAVAPSSGATLIMALFVLTQILIFDQEAVFTLFGWIRKLPVLVGLMLVSPFTAMEVPRR